MKKRIFALIFAAMMTGMCCVSCGGSESSRQSNVASYTKAGVNGKTMKERISAADKTAEAALTACNDALAELKNSGENIAVEGWFDSETPAAAELETIRTKTAELAGELDEPYSVYVKNGAAVAAVGIKVDFYGTYPTGLVHTNYYSELGDDPTLDDAKAYALRLFEGK